MPRSAPSRAGEVLDDLVDRLEFRDRLREYAVFGAWADEVGETLARRTEPLRIEDGKLVVRVDGSAWMQELHFLKREIRERLNRRLRAALVRDIYLVLGRVRRRAAVVEAPVVHPVDEQQIAALVPAIGNAEIEAALRRVVRARGRRLGRLVEDEE